MLLGQAPVTIDGHVFHAEGHSPCGDALIQAWPCGSTFTADLDGRFEASCPEGIDSVTVLAGHAVWRTSSMVEATSPLPWNR